MVTTKPGGKAKPRAKLKTATATTTRTTRSAVSPAAKKTSKKTGAKKRRPSKTLPTAQSRKDESRKDEGEKSKKTKVHEEEEDDGDKKPAAIDKKKAASVRPNKNFDVLNEDYYLCQAYVNVSTDARIGNAQKGGAFWQKVALQFSKLRSEDANFVDWPERDSNAVMNRFRRHIQCNTQLYNSYYARVKEKNKSGTNEADYIADAANLFLQEKGKPFLWSHCIEVLHKIPKLNPTMPDLTGSDDEDGGVNKIRAPMGAGAKRPQGAKAAKASSKASMKKKRLDAFSIASIETRKTNSMETVGQATVRLAESTEFRVTQDSLLEEVKVCMQLGMQQRAMDLMDAIASNRLAFQAKIKRRDSLLPVQIDLGIEADEDDESAPSQTSSGHRLSTKEKAAYKKRKQEDEEEEEEEGEEEDDEEGEEEQSDGMSPSIREDYNKLKDRGVFEESGEDDNSIAKAQRDSHAV
jgi:hypothetical protein